MMKERQLMQQFLPVRKAFLIAAFIFVLNYVFGTLVALQLNLSDPVIGGTSRDHWLTTGTPLNAPAGFMIIYVIFLLLATRQRWMGIIGIVGVSLLTLISALSLTTDWGMVQRVIEHHLTILTGLTLAVLVATYPTIIILGIVTLIQQGRVSTSAAIP
jgi:hypothetical protein